MVQRLRGRLTYANVTATIALFLALSGGVAWALASNTVKSKHIVNDQVKSVDVRDDSLSGGGLTGADIREDTLGEVPQAFAADNAQAAEQADNAGLLDNKDSSDFLGSDRVASFAFNSGAGDPNTLADIGGVQLSASCQQPEPLGDATLAVRGTSSDTRSSGASYNRTSAAADVAHFQQGSTTSIGDTVFSRTAASGVSESGGGTIVIGSPFAGSPQVSIAFSYSIFPDQGLCFLSGTALSAP